MKNAYAALGALFLFVMLGAAYAFHSSSSQQAVSIQLVPIVSTTTGMHLTSPAFKDGESIPALYTCDGTNISPPLSMADVPSGAKSLALIVDDPDVPRQLLPDGVFDHWVLFNMPPDTTDISKDSSAGIAGANGAGKSAYTGPCPPSQYEPSTHRYVFVLYALDALLALPAGASKEELLRAMDGHILEQAELIGMYKKK